jgi:hypothetical protein
MLSPPEKQNFKTFMAVLAVVALCINYWFYSKEPPRTSPSPPPTTVSPGQVQNPVKAANQTSEPQVPTNITTSQNVITNTFQDAIKIDQPATTRANTLGKR